MLKLVILFINLAMASKTVTCDSSGCLYSGAGTPPAINSTPNAKVISFDNRVDGESVLEVKSGLNLNSLAVVIEGRNSTHATDLNIDLSARFDKVSFGNNNALNAPNVITSLDSINNITINLSGNDGDNGDPFSVTCLKSALSGNMDSRFSTGALIKNAVLGRRTLGDPSYDGSAPSNKCDLVDIQLIENILAPGTNSKVCSTDFSLMNGWNNAISLKRIKPKKMCVPSGLPYVAKRCKISTNRYYCGVVMGQMQQECTYSEFGSSCHYTPVQSYSASSAVKWLMSAVDPLFTSAYSKTETVFYDPSFQVSYTGSQSAPIFSPTNLSPALVRGTVPMYLLMRKNNSTISDYVVYANSYSSAMSKCKTQAYPGPGITYVTSGKGGKLFSSSDDTYYDNLDSYDYGGATPGQATYFPLMIPDGLSIYYETTTTYTSCSDSALVNSALAANGYNVGNPWPATPINVEEISTIPSSQTTFVAVSSPCPDGTGELGIVRKYDVCITPRCENSGETEAISCSSLSCAEGTLFLSNKTFNGIEVEVDGGENGSKHGYGNLFAFNFTGTLTVLSQSGVDGDGGQVDLVIPQKQKTCYKKDDEDLWKDKNAITPQDLNADYRSNPVLSQEHISFSAVSAVFQNKAKHTYDPTTSIDVKVFTHTDFNVRKLLLKESQ